VKRARKNSEKKCLLNLKSILFEVFKIKTDLSIEAFENKIVHFP
jgi:hypothetical protein